MSTTSDQSPLKLTLLGDMRVGKSALVQQLSSSRFTSAYKATIGSDIVKKELTVDGQPVTLQIWDTAGQPRFQSIPISRHSDSHCCVLVFDMTDAPSFEKIDSLRDEFLAQAAQRNPGEFPFVVLGNKIDQDDKRAVTTERAQAWCQSKGAIPYIETSAKEATNVEEAFQTIAKLALQRKQRQEAAGGTEDT